MPDLDPCFEALLTHLSAAAMGMSTRNVRPGLDEAAGRMIRFLELDGCCMLESPNTAKSGIAWRSVTYPSQDRDCPLLDSDLEWLSPRLWTGETVALGSIPQEHGRRLKSLLAFPLATSNESRQAVVFWATRIRGEWTPILIARARLVAQMLAHAGAHRSTWQKLQMIEQRYTDLAESQADMVCRYLPDTTLTFVNHAYCRFFGRERGELVGRRILELIPESARQYALDAVSKMAGERCTSTTEHEVLLPDGSIGWMRWTDTPLIGEDGTVTEFQAIGRDVTERRRMEDSLRNLAQASRLAMVGELSAAITHEVTQPLSAIQSNIDAIGLLLGSDSTHMPSIHTILEDVRMDVRRATEVVRRVRTLLRNPELKPELLDIEEIAAEAVRLSGLEARRRGVNVMFHPGNTDAQVFADRICLHQVLMNLIINAVQAVESQAEGCRHVTVGSFSHGDGEVGIAVRDTGPGIAVDDLPRLFDAFFTTRKDGLGLGLRLARSLTEVNGGRVWVDRNAEGGTTFGITLPRPRLAACKAPPLSSGHSREDAA
ncbi:MAG: PAS domain S-box protein [Burkholderiales bacterium]|nr:PAS domain S-box protein [Burkholderiales bacterium]